MNRRRTAVLRGYWPRSDVPFRNGHDKLGGTAREVVPWDYSYIPVPAGGVAFTYHIAVHGHLIRNLRLTGKTLMQIFTGQITNWDSPQITRDYGARLPDLPITPVIHAEASGVTYTQPRRGLRAAHCRQRSPRP